MVYNGLMFREKIAEHSKWVVKILEEHPDIAQIEERTKGSLIDPLIRCLGYDPNNPGHVMREAVTDTGKKKVDYMLTGQNSAKIAVEAKSASTTLSSAAIQQLREYFTFTKAVAALLTNGIDYWLFTDLDTSNVMDLEPYRKIDIRYVTDKDLCQLDCFSRNMVSKDSVHEQATAQKHQAQINSIVAEELQSPSQEFLKLVGKKAGIKPLNQKNLAFLEPLVEEAISRNLSREIHPSLHPDPKPEPSGSDVSERKSNTDSEVTPGRKAAETLKRFKGATLFGQPLACKNYVTLLTSVVEEMQTRHPDEFAEQVSDSKAFKGRKWWYISKRIDDLSPAQTKDRVGDYWVDVNLDALGKIRRARLFLRTFGHDPDDLQIHTKDDPTPA